MSRAGRAGPATGLRCRAVADPNALPKRQLAIVTCMDVRLHPTVALGLEPGDAHVLRNAGAVVSDDVLRSLVLSQRLLQTRSVVVMGHTDCGVEGLDGRDLVSTLVAETGVAPPYEFEGFDDVHVHVRQQVERVRQCPWLPHVDDVRGYVFDVVEKIARPVL